MRVETWHRPSRIHIQGRGQTLSLPRRLSQSPHGPCVSRCLSSVLLLPLLRGTRSPAAYLLAGGPDFDEHRPHTFRGRSRRPTSSHSESLSACTCFSSLSEPCSGQLAHPSLRPCPAMARPVRLTCAASRPGGKRREPNCRSLIKRSGRQLSWPASCSGFPPFPHYLSRVQSC